MSRYTLPDPHHLLWTSSVNGRSPARDGLSKYDKQGDRAVSSRQVQALGQERTGRTRRCTGHGCAGSAPATSNQHYRMTEPYSKRTPIRVDLRGAFLV